MNVELEWYEKRLAVGVGKARRRESEGRKGAYGRRNKDMTPEELLREDIETTGAEIAVAKALNLYWGGHVNVFSKDPDVGRAVQVRSVTSWSHCLIVRQDDLDEQFFFLVYRDFPKFKIVGYIKGERAKQEKWKRAPNDREAAYFVPPEALRAVKEKD